VNKKDEERLTELKLHVYGEVARKHIEGDKHPTMLLKRAIESHGGRIAKALRLLGDDGVIAYSYSYSKEYNEKNKVHKGWGSHQEEVPGSEELYEVLTFDTDAPNYEKEPSFAITWKALYGEIMRGNVSSLSEYGLSGDRQMHEISDAGRIYVYFHNDEFLFDGLKYNVRNTKKSPGVYPERHNEARQKAILKCSVERHFQKDFTRKLEEYLGIKRRTYRDDDHISFGYRNFAKHPVTFTKEYFEGSQGFMEEFEHYKQYVLAMQAQLKEFVEIVKAHGGYEAIIEEMRRDSIEKIFRNAPKNVHIKAKKSRGYLENDEEIQDKWASQFILQHRPWFNYETLYGDDCSMGHIQYYGAVGEDAFQPFDPELRDVQLIQEYKEKICKTESVQLQDSLKLISETFTKK